jgi:putative transcriptional regulator
MTRISASGKIESRIQEYRGARKLTQQELAEAVRVTRATIVALERGDYNPSLELAFRLSKFFDAKIEELFKFKSN